LATTSGCLILPLGAMRRPPVEARASKKFSAACDARLTALMAPTVGPDAWPGSAVIIASIPRSVRSL